MRATFLALLLPLVAHAGHPISLSDTSWPNLSATPPPPLNELTNPVFSAYSVTRKLLSSYSGFAFQVSAGGTNFDIGFSGNLVDTNALVTSAGANSAYLTVLYDQSGNGKDLTNSPSATDSFRVVNSGAPELDANGHLRARANASNLSYLRTDSFNLTGTNISYYLVFMAYGESANNVFVCLDSTEGGVLQQGTGTLDLHSAGTTLTGPSYSTNVQYLVTGNFNNTSSDRIRLNDGSFTTGSAGNSLTGPVSIGYKYSPVTVQFYLSELFVWSTAVGDGDDAILSGDINAFYGLW